MHYCPLHQRKHLDAKYIMFEETSSSIPPIKLSDLALLMLSTSKVSKGWLLPFISTARRRP